MEEKKKRGSEVTWEKESDAPLSASMSME